jgi:hypothetical protein
MESLEKKVYEAPAIEVVEVNVEGSICTGSGDETPGHGNGYPTWF